MTHVQGPRQHHPQGGGRFFATVKARLMGASALIIAASVALTTFMVLQRVEGRGTQAVLDLERDNAERIAALLGQRVVGLQKMLRAAAGVVPPGALSDPAAAAAFLTANQALGVNFANTYLADAAGQVLALHDGTRADHPAVQLHGRDWFRRTMTEGVPVVSAPLIGRVSREPVIQFTMPVPGADGKVAGVLGAALRLTTRNLFDDLTYSGHSEGDHIVTIVTDAQGQVISHPRRERVMRNIETEPDITETVARWVAQGRPVEPTGFASLEQGHFVAMAGVPGADWMVLRVAPADELLGGLAQARREALQWAAGVALLGGLLVLGLLAAWLGPLTRLRERALQLQDASLPVDQGWPQAQGEIGALSDVLQQVLRERTAGEQDRQLLLQQMGSVLAAAPVGIAITREREFVLVGAEFNTLLGWTGEQLVGRQAREIFASQIDYEGLGASVGRAFASGRPFFGELQFQRRDGGTFWGRLQGRPVDAANGAAGTIWLLEDVTEHRELRERLSWSASHDALTRLLNRATFEERFSSWLQQAGADDVATLVCIDLDRFKAVNDNAGHAAGDTVLREVAAALHRHVRGGDQAARLGGDEFALLLQGCDAAAATALATRLREAIAAIAIEHAGQTLGVDASIGVVEVHGATGADAAAWLAQADAACYQAKRAGRGRVQTAALPVPA